MPECRSHCTRDMICLSNKLRQIDVRTTDNVFLQDEIQQLMEILVGHGHAMNVAHVLLQDIIGASIPRMVPLLKCVVKCLSKIRGNLLVCFEFWLPDSIEDIFEVLCEKNDVRTRLDLFSLRKEWRAIFTVKTIRDINERLHRLDPKWPIYEYDHVLSSPSDLSDTSSSNLSPMASSTPIQPFNSPTVSDTTTDSGIVLFEGSITPSHSSLTNVKLSSSSSSSRLTKNKYYDSDQCRKIVNDIRRSTESQPTPSRISSFGRLSMESQPTPAKRFRLSSVGSTSSSSSGYSTRSSSVSDRENDVYY